MDTILFLLVSNTNSKTKTAMQWSRTVEQGLYRYNGIRLLAYCGSELCIALLLWARPREDNEISFYWTHRRGSDANLYLQNSNSSLNDIKQNSSVHHSIRALLHSKTLSSMASSASSSSSSSSSPLSSPPMSPASSIQYPLQNPRTQDVFKSIVKGRKSWKTLKGGEVVWPPDLEAALIEGAWVILLQLSDGLDSNL